MTSDEITLICTLIKNKYIGKEIGDIFDGIQNPYIKFDDLIINRGGLGTNLCTLIWPSTRVIKASILSSFVVCFVLVSQHYLI